MIELYSGTDKIRQLPKRKGGYFYIGLTNEVVQSFPKQKSTRIVCSIDKGLSSFQCGLNHMGDGNFFIIISTKNLKPLQKQVDDQIDFTIFQDPNPLGVDIPESIQALLTQDESLNSQFESLSLGKRRSIIHRVKNIKNIDLQISRTVQLIEEICFNQK